MDDFFRLTRRERTDGKKLVIYAPHHSMLDSDLLHFSTFEYNYTFMLDLAKKYSDKVAWVFKPHPVLKTKVMQKGLFKNVEEWNVYLDEWRNLPDAEVVEEGMYTQLFLDSDAMIFDSCSFMSEYVFADKPALFLTRPEQSFTNLGKMAKEVHYTADGKDFKAIEDFLCNVVLDGNDTKKDERHRFFEENLDYRKNGCLAAENIFNELCRELS
jgi:CDP-glycerol glycerophosphotransferase (TagB/SpsB family)